MGQHTAWHLKTQFSFSFGFLFGRKGDVKLSPDLWEGDFGSKE